MSPAMRHAARRCAVTKPRQVLYVLYVLLVLFARSRPVACIRASVTGTQLLAPAESLFCHAVLFQQGFTSWLMPAKT